MLPSLRDRAKALKRDTLALWLAARDHRTPLAAKLLAGGVAAYALSPIDLIPDFIPVLGLIDDLLIVPVGIWLVLKLIPAPLMAELRERAGKLAERPNSMVGLLLVLSIWFALAAVTGLYLIREV
ncbi:YkvA family protein [Qipengyuania gaetbuli]|uniref:YkvA family protein n=1 Tax=Qipengyuania gaetbuli TaxID=266952 RepID=UPI001CFDC12D|nr:YkvA family protein [Qipengyuania gaetbuli]